MCLLEQGSPGRGSRLPEPPASVNTGPGDSPHPAARTPEAPLSASQRGRAEDGSGRKRGSQQLWGPQQPQPQVGGWAGVAGPSALLTAGACQGQQLQGPGCQGPGIPLAGWSRALARCTQEAGLAHTGGDPAPHLCPPICLQPSLPGLSPLLAVLAAPPSEPAHGQEGHVVSP